MQFLSHWWLQRWYSDGPLLSSIEFVQCHVGSWIQALMLFIFARILTVSPKLKIGYCSSLLGGMALSPVTNCPTVCGESALEAIEMRTEHWGMALAFQSQTSSLLQTQSGLVRNLYSAMVYNTLLHRDQALFIVNNDEVGTLVPTISFEKEDFG